MKSIRLVILLGLLVLAGTHSVGARGRAPTVQPMDTPTARELGYEQGYPPQGQCRVNTAALYGACTAPLDGLRVQVVGSPQAGLFVTLPASTTETRDHLVRVKAAVGNPAINDQVGQSVYGQLIVHGRLVVGVRMQGTWQFRRGERHCGGTTNWYDVAACSEMPLAFGSRDGDTVRVVVSFTYKNRVYRSSVTYKAFSD